MKIAVSGASGLVGSALVAALTADGHHVARLVRSKSSGDPDSIFWDPAKSVLDGAALAGCDAVVHLAGESIAARRWNAAQKSRILSSRTRGTRLVAETMAALDAPPATLVSASAIGFYGDRGDEVLNEDSGPGEGFLADVCMRWEAATEAARARGVRVVNLRIGVVLDPAGGALERMLTPFRLGLGGKVGSGRQWMSWITTGDLVGAIRHALVTPSLAGPANATAPHPVTQGDFAKTLGRVLSRPAVVPLPAFAVRLAFGEMGDELLLASTRVDSRRLADSGYTFRHPKLNGALEHLLP